MVHQAAIDKIRGFLCATALAVVTLSLIPAHPASAKPNRDVLYQISTIDALMVGLYDGSTTIGELTRHGDFGLGTFDRLDGEMVVVDGIVYQVTSYGVAHKVSAGATSPFAAVTMLDRDSTVKIARERSFTALKDYLDSLLPSKNMFHAIRIEGTFACVRVRSVPPQSKPYRGLAEVTAHQPEFEFTDVKGTIVALRCPYFVRGINVPGYHMHFLTTDRKRGGHVLDCVVKEGLVTLDPTGEFVLALPKDKDFLNANLQTRSLQNVE